MRYRLPRRPRERAVVARRLGRNLTAWSKTSMHVERQFWRDVTGHVSDVVLGGAVGTLAVWAASGAPSPLQWLAIGGVALGAPIVRLWYSRRHRRLR